MMENKKQMVIETFNRKFDLQRFINFTQELFKGNARYKSNIEFSPKVKGEFKDVVKEFAELGWYKDKNKKNMVLAIIRLEREDSVARSRAIQRNFVKDYFLKNGNDSALVAFYNNNSEDWRLSFIKLDYSYKEAKLEEEITPAKRFSFLLGENEKHHTAISRFLPLLNNDSEAPTIDEIEEAFNIEIVTKEFFEKYCDLYLEIKKCLDEQEEFKRIEKELDFRSDEFAKKLMGQLVFLYFLQKKGWLGVEANPAEIAENEACKLLENKNYDAVEVFDKVYELKDNKYVRNDNKITILNDEEVSLLNSIFINTKYDANWGSGDKNFIRSLYNRAAQEEKNFYKDYLEHIFYNGLNDKRGGSTYFKKLNCKIPFLNGGLFQPISENYNWETAEFNIPNDIFSNKKKSNLGDIGTGILDIFDRYAFTIKEDEPLEKEVAVDPEMLGKVFENLLDVVDRKKKGAFYTPREIVHYMCQESLINYLNIEIGIEYKSAEALIRYGDVLADIDSSKKAFETGEFKMPLEVRKNAKKIDNALLNVKIADPAVGSGAFPLGMLNEIVRARMNLTQYMADDVNSIHRGNDNAKGRRPYDLKLQTIQRCIHAVDIERSAVDIAKLRLWLSLVVEENDFKNVKPLPNLDYNIMVGNSLLEEFEGVKLFNEKLLEEKNKEIVKEVVMEQIGIFNGKKESEYLLDEIYGLQEKFFSANSKEEKIRLKNEIDNLEWILIERTVKENGQEELLPKIIEFKRTNTKPYFLWKLNFAKVFREKGGFDIVIGNPPYAAKFDKKMKKILDVKYPNVPDYESSDYFICKGYEILKRNGIISYIIPNTILANILAEKFRKELISKWNFIKIDNLSQIDIFESAKVRNCILLFKKVGEEALFTSKFANTIVKKGNYLAENEKELNSNFLMENIDNWLSLFTRDDCVTRIIKKIRDMGQPLSKFAELSQGLIPYDKYRGHSPEIIKNRIWHSDFKKDETYRKELQGKDIDRYVLRWNGKTWISYGEWLAAPRKPEFFRAERILVREITNPRILAAYTNEEYYNTPSIINIINFKEIEIKYVLAVLNSKMMSFYHINTSPKAMKGLFPKILVNDLRNMPIVKIDNKIEEQVRELVDKIINISKSDVNDQNKDNLKKLEFYNRCIDEIIYKIYKLDDNDIKIIEESLK